MLYIIRTDICRFSRLPIISRVAFSSVASSCIFVFHLVMRSYVIECQRIRKICNAIACIYRWWGRRFKAQYFESCRCRIFRSNSEGTSTGHRLTTANLKLKCLIQYKNSSFLHILPGPLPRTRCDLLCLS